MFEIELKPTAIVALRTLDRLQARTITDSIQVHLRHEPERPTRNGRIKKLRGRQQTTYRLRVGDYRVFYDVHECTVSVAAILHKSETFAFYLPEKQP